MNTVSPRAGILNIQPHMVATPAARPGVRKVDLSNNESAMGPSPNARAAAREAIDEIERYPDEGPRHLAAAIGQAFGLDPARIVCGHGSDELLQRLARGYVDPGDEVIHSVHGYLKFPNYAYAMDAVPVAAPDEDFRASVDGILSRVTRRTRMVLLANPDNPTGTFLGGQEIRRLHAGLPGNVLLVLDSAYAEYVTASDYELPAALIDETSNVVMTRTFSKVFGLAGMRLGWLYGPPAVVDVLHRLGLTFPISRPALAAGIAAVSDQPYMRQVHASNRERLARFARDMQSLGLRVIPSNTNFQLLDFTGQRTTARQAYDFLETRGIVGRLFNQADYRNMLRLTIGLDEEMRLATAALRECLSA
jgi:histidinol-phosphate aminotransferase